MNTCIVMLSTSIFFFFADSSGTMPANLSASALAASSVFRRSSVTHPYPHVHATMTVCRCYGVGRPQHGGYMGGTIAQVVQHNIAHATSMNLHTHTHTHTLHKPVRRPAPQDLWVRCQAPNLAVRQVVHLKVTCSRVRLRSWYPHTDTHTHTHK